MDQAHHDLPRRDAERDMVSNGRMDISPTRWGMETRMGLKRIPEERYLQGHHENQWDQQGQKDQLHPEQDKKKDEVKV